MPDQPDLSLKVGLEGSDSAVSELQRMVKALESLTDALTKGKKAAQEHATGHKETGNALHALVESMGGVRESFEHGSAATSGFGGVLNVLKSMLSPTTLAITGVVLALGGLVAALEKSGEAALQTFQRVRQLQAVSGMAADEATVMSRAFEAAGADSGGLTTALFRLGIATENNGEGLSLLGISIRRVSGEMKTEGEILLEVRDRLSGLGSASAVSAAGMELMGRSFRAMIPAFSLSKEKFDELLETEKKHTAINEAFMVQAREVNKEIVQQAHAEEDLNIRIAKVLSLPFEKTMHEWKKALFETVAVPVSEWLTSMAEHLGDTDSALGQLKIVWENVWVSAKDLTIPVANILKDVLVPAIKLLGAVVAAVGIAMNVAFTLVAGPITYLGSLLDDLSHKRFPDLKRATLEANAATADARVRLAESGEAFLKLAYATDEASHATKGKTEADKEGEAAEVAHVEAIRKTKAEIKLATDMIKTEIEERRRQLKADEAYFSEKTKMETGSAQASVAARLELAKELEALAQEQYDRELAEQQNLIKVQGGSLSAEVMAKLTKERDMKVLEAQNEVRKLGLEMQKAGAADTKRVMEDELKDAKRSTDIFMKDLESRKAEEMAANEVRRDSSTSMILEKRNIEERYAAEARERRRADIADESDRLRALAALYPQNFDLQREIATKLKDLGRDRAVAEADADNKILAARKAMVEGLQAEAEKEAGIGESLTSKALANLKKRGKTRATEADVEQEVSRMRRGGIEATSAYRGGGRVKIEQLEDAMSNKGAFGSMAKMGTSQSGAMGQFMQQMMQNFMGVNAMNVPSMMQQKSPQGMVGETAGASDAWAKTRTEDFKKAAEDAVGKLDFKGVLESLGDSLIRKLEFEAQRG